MMQRLPIDLSKVDREDIDREILRAAIIAELDAINFYEQLAAMATDENVQAVLLDVAREEKTHVGEFQALLLRLDEEQAEELENGAEEVEELLGE
ncbi:ferritin family protein [Desulfothermobacter acidiphilus]|uniref:ferritin family protein n=1 Tax=Desulfothermobacter acidiphilus TaxID=1938353 RepID=UPI003F8A17A1